MSLCKSSPIIILPHAAKRTVTKRVLLHTTENVCQKNTVGSPTVPPVYSLAALENVGIPVIIKEQSNISGKCICFGNSNNY